MSEIQDFLTAVLPDQGTYCIVSIPPERGGAVTQQFTGNRNDLIAIGDNLTHDGQNAYFALATFTAEKRAQDRVHALRAFWLDLDCGKGKPYADHEEGLEALSAFLSKTNLPAPTLVNSGNGFHVYWPLDCILSKDDWQPVADRLSAACAEYGFAVDPAPTADSARILRLPGSLNMKDADNPKDVSVFRQVEPVYFDFFKAALDGLNITPKKPRKPRKSVDTSQMSETAKALINSRASSFGKIARRSIKGTGCAALRHIITKQAEIEEPLWRAGLSVAWACEDRDTAIHKMSSRHPGYDEAETLQKASLTQGPYTCETFRRLDPDLCEGCTHKLSSPIQLGDMVVRAEPEEEPEEPEEPEESQADNAAGAPFNPPWPYFRAAKGGIYKEDGDGDEKKEDRVYEYDLYPIKRIIDPNDGESIVWKINLPHDGEHEFTVPLKRMLSLDSFRDTFGYEGVVATQKQLKDIMDYAIRYTKELQKLYRAHRARLQFGWTGGKNAFVVGNKAYTAKGVQHNPASSTTADYLRHMEPKGELSEWRQAFNVLARPGMEALQFGALTGFAAPLMEFTGHAGATINLISNESGTGKSTAGYLALSVFGDPKQTALVEADTHLAKLHHIGVMNNLVVMSDEMTNMSPEVASSLIYAVSQGRARHRMERDANQLRKNISAWRTIMLTNSNASIMSKLSQTKARPDGEMMRLLEIPVKRVYVEDADVLFDKMFTNYGVAGEVYAAWLAKNRDRIPELYDKQKRRILDVIGKQMEERFWVATASAILASGRIAQKLGLHDYDMTALEIWVCEFLLALRDDVRNEITMADNLIGEFLLDNLNGILAMGERINPVTGTNVLMPKGNRAVARFELKNNTMFIAKKAFRTYCVDRQFTEKEALRESTTPGSSFRYVRTLKKRMLAGTEVAAPSTDAHLFECDPDEANALFEAIEKQAGKDDEDA